MVLAASPMACTATCSPAASAAARTGLSWSSGQIGPSLPPSKYGSCMAAVQASITPSDTNFTPTTRKPGPKSRAASSAARRTWAMFCRLVPGVGDEPVRGQAHGQPAAVALQRALDGGQADLVEGHVHRAGDPGGKVRLEDAVKARIALGVAGHRGKVRPNDLLGCGFQQQARGVPVFVAHDPPADRVRRLAGDAQLGQGRAVDPAGVVVVVVQVDGHIRDRRVEHGGRRPAVGNRVEEPTAAEHACGLGGRRPGCGEPGLDFLQRAGRGELDLGQGLAGHQQVGVRVDEAGNHQVAVEVDLLGVRAGEGPGLGGGSGKGDLPVFDDQRLGPGRVRVGVGGEDAGVGVQRGGHAAETPGW